MLTLSEKRKIGKYVRGQYEYTNGRNVRFEPNGAVTIVVDQMPNTNEGGRIFVGWGVNLLKDAGGLMND